MTNNGIPGYKILKSIGKGGTSNVFLAIQMSVGRTIAIKVLARQFSEDKKFSQRFLKEANCGVLKHPNIITIHDAGESNGHLYIAMEYLLGGDLKQRMLKGLNESDVIRIITQITQALSHAHNNNFTHRDIKPGNILFDENNNAILADFGIAKTIVFSEHKTTPDKFLGTPNYISPEQVSNQLVDHRSDLYSLGVVYYEILTGKKLFTADSPYALMFKHLKEPVPELDKKYKQHQPIIKKLLEKKPSKRYQSADSLLQDLSLFNTLESAKKPTVSTFKSSGILVTLLISFSAIMYFQLRPEVIKIETPQPVIEELSSNAKTIQKLQADIKKSFALNKALKEDRVKLDKISAHLTTASKYISIEQFIRPENKNALYEFRRVINISPDNIQAQYGIETILSHYILLAEDEKLKKNYVNSIKHINEGLVVDDKNTTLLSLHKETTQLLKQQITHNKIKKALKKANRLIKKERLIDARTKLREIKKLDKNNKKINSILAVVNKKIRSKKYIENLFMQSIELLNETPITELNLNQACMNIYQILQLIPEDNEIDSIKRSCAYQYLLLSRQEKSTADAIELIETGLNYSPNNPELTQQLKKLLTPIPVKPESKPVTAPKINPIERFRSY